MRVNRPLVTFLLVVGCLASLLSCGSSGEDSDADFFAVVEEVRRQYFVQLPAFDDAVFACMAQEGFDYESRVLGPSAAFDVEASTYRNLGISALFPVVVVGEDGSYGFVDSTLTVVAKLEARSEPPPPDYLAVLHGPGGCWDEALTDFPAVARLGELAGSLDSHHSELVEGIVGTAEFAAWSRCMSDAGFKEIAPDSTFNEIRASVQAYIEAGDIDPTDLVVDVDGDGSEYLVVRPGPSHDLVDELRAFESAVARADIACDQSGELRAAAATVFTSILDHVLNEHP